MVRNASRHAAVYAGPKTATQRRDIAGVCSAPWGGWGCQHAKYVRCAIDVTAYTVKVFKIVLHTRCENCWVKCVHFEQNDNVICVV